MSDYEVGYGKPPRKSQFKPGQSGNPKGRPKGRKGFSTILVEELSEDLVGLLEDRACDVVRDLRPGVAVRALTFAEGLS